MGMRIPREIGEIKIDEELYSLYALSYIDSLTEKILREIGIGPIAIEGTVTKRLAIKIADKHGVRIITANFGGDSAGNPPIPRKMFAVPVSEEVIGYICIKGGKWEEASEEITKEFSEAKKKLIEAAEELEWAIEKFVDSVLHL